MGMTVVFSTLQGAFNLNVYSGQPLTVVHGACPTGADKLAHLWVARMHRWQANDLVQFSEGDLRPLRGVEVIEEPWPADWDRWGANAGPIRNREMAELGATFCLAFLYEPDGRVSKGTRGMMREAWSRRIEVIEVPWHF
jgi:hypothetical protein